MIPVDVNTYNAYTGSGGSSCKNCSIVVIDIEVKSTTKTKLRTKTNAPPDIVSFLLPFLDIDPK
jgi:hypothetical protein